MPPEMPPETLANLMKTTIQGLQQMLKIMVDCSPSGELNITEAFELQKLKEQPDQKEVVTSYATFIRTYMSTLIGSPGLPADQLRYIIKTFLMHLASNPNRFPSKKIYDTVTHGTKKVPSHPLNCVNGNTVEFVPYMIIELKASKDKPMQRYVLSAWKSVSGEQTTISTWIFNQRKYHTNMAELKNKGLDWTPVDDPSEPTMLKNMKLDIMEDMQWSQIDWTYGQSEPTGLTGGACGDLAEKCLHRLLGLNNDMSNEFPIYNGQSRSPYAVPANWSTDGLPHENQIMAVRDVRYEGLKLNTDKNKDEITEFAYAPKFGEFALQTPKQ